MRWLAAMTGTNYNDNAWLAGGDWCQPCSDWIKELNFHLACLTFLKAFFHSQRHMHTNLRRPAHIFSYKQVLLTWAFCQVRSKSEPGKRNRREVWVCLGKKTVDHQAYNTQGSLSAIAAQTLESWVAHPCMSVTCRLAGAFSSREMVTRT